LGESSDFRAQLAVVLAGQFEVGSQAGLAGAGSGELLPVGLCGLVGAGSLDVVADPVGVDQPGRYLGCACDQREGDRGVGVLDLVDCGEDAGAFLVGVALSCVFEDVGGGAGAVIGRSF
jgi:hypothetical protein